MQIVRYAILFGLRMNIIKSNTNDGITIEIVYKFNITKKQYEKQIFDILFLISCRIWRK